MKNVRFRNVLGLLLAVVMCVSVFTSVEDAYALNSSYTHYLECNLPYGGRQGGLTSIGSLTLKNRFYSSPGNNVANYLSGINNHGLDYIAAFCLDPLSTSTSGHTYGKVGPIRTASLTYLNNFSANDRRFIAAVVEYYQNNPTWTGSNPTGDWRDKIAKLGTQTAIFEYVLDSSSKSKLHTAVNNKTAAYASYASDAYNYASSKIASTPSVSVKVPSFHNTVVEMTLQSTGTYAGKYVGTVTDTNGAISTSYYSNYNFNTTLSNGIVLSRSGNTVTIVATPAQAEAAGLFTSGNSWSYSSTAQARTTDNINTDACVVYKDNNNSAAQPIVLWDSSVSATYIYASATATLKAHCAAPNGTLKVTKSSGNTTITNNNACYSVSGAVYKVYNSSANATAGTNAVATLTTTSTGESNSVSLSPGTYYIKEYSASAGYKLDTTVYTVTVTANATTNKAVTEVPITGTANVKVNKKDSVTQGAPSAGQSLQGAEYTYKFYGGSYSSVADAEASNKLLKTWVIKTNASGIADITDTSLKVSGDAFYTDSSSNVILPLGTLVIQETKASSGYSVNSDKILVRITKTSNAETISISATAPVSYETPLKGGVKIKKVDAETNGTPQGNASLQGAVFSILNKNGKTIKIGSNTYANNAEIMTITTNASGVATTSNSALPFGSYRIVEKTAPTGYTLNSSFYKDFTISASGTIVDAGTCANTVIHGGLSVQKSDADLGTTTPMGGASFEGITFSIYNASTNAVRVGGKTYQPNALITTIVTNSTGLAQTAVDALPYGDYKVVETGVIAANGYALNSSFQPIMKVRTNGQRTNAMYATASATTSQTSFPNTASILGGLEVHKLDATSQLDVPQGDATLAGAVFNVYNASAYAVRVSGKAYAVNAKIMTITTDANGIAYTGQVLPKGTYRVTEETAPTGYLKNTTWSETGEISSHGMTYVLSGSAACKDTVIKGGIAVQKYDAQTYAETNSYDQAKNNPMYSLADAEITIINRSAHAIWYNGRQINPYSGTFNPANRNAVGIVTRIYTDANGVATTGNLDLPYGTYEIYETAAPYGYEINTTWTKTIQIRANGTIYTQSTTNGLMDPRSLGADEGVPGGGGGLFGGMISPDSAVAGGGSGYVGNGSSVESGYTADGDMSNPAVPDGSDDGYVRINLISST